MKPESSNALQALFDTLGAAHRRRLSLVEHRPENHDPWDHINLAPPRRSGRTTDNSSGVENSTGAYNSASTPLQDSYVRSAFDLVMESWEYIPRSLDNVSSYDISRLLCNAIAAIEHRISLISSDISATDVGVFRRTIEEIRGLVYCRAIPLLSEDDREARHDRNLALQNLMYEFSLAVRWFGEAVDEWYSKKKDGEDPEPCQ